MTYCHLTNVVQIYPKVSSGGEPAGEEAFRELQQLGFKTVVSVDGAKPNIELAKEYGLRYVHLPHGYDGIPAKRVQELAKAVRELEGPIYIHCHHGKHRSPAAASVACIAAGLISTEDGLEVLQLAGTSPHYRGLTESVRSVRTLDSNFLDSLVVEFHSVVEVPPMADAMVDIEKNFDRIRVIAKSGWCTPEEHPDLVPAHEALLLREQYTELLRSDLIQHKPVEFKQLLKEAEQLSQTLEEKIRNRDAGNLRLDGTEELNLLHERLQRNCQSCHQRFRDSAQTNR